MNGRLLRSPFYLRGTLEDLEGLSYQETRNQVSKPHLLEPQSCQEVTISPSGVQFVKKMAIIRGLVQGDSNQKIVLKLGFNHHKLMIKVCMWSKLKMVKLRSKLKMFKELCSLKVICILDMCSKLKMLV